MKNEIAKILPFEKKPKIIAHFFLIINMKTFQLQIAKSLSLHF